ncbi:MAG: hypothetical protein HY870_09675 [Chloroflexi bacterium]|nr:hypothetical protein [Chloroflexota bacterium]
MIDKISTEQISDALKRSGYLLESRIENTLRDKGFYVEANSAYLDPVSAKSRELDIFATRGYWVGPNEHEFIYSVLLIEAVNNPQPIAFITKESQVTLLHREDIKMAGLPVKVQGGSSNDSWVFLPEYLEMNEYHHYCKGRVATQYCSFAQKKNETKEWMAVHDEAHFNNFLTLSLAIEYFRDYLYRAWRKGSAEMINIEFYYPVIIVQGELLEVQSIDGDINITPTNHIQYRRTSVIDTTEVNYQIDVINERYLSEFLNIVNAELEHTVHLLHEQHVIVRAAISKIVKQASRANTYEGIKGFMDLNSLSAR